MHEVERVPGWWMRSSNYHKLGWCSWKPSSELCLLQPRFEVGRLHVVLVLDGVLDDVLDDALGDV
jgi:hypothetical protein